MEVRPQLNLVELAVAATIGFVGLNAVEGGWPAVALVAGVVLLGLSTLRHGERLRAEVRQGTSAASLDLGGPPALDGPGRTDVAPPSLEVSAPGSQSKASRPREENPSTANRRGV